MEWIYFVIIFFYILSALSKATKKKQEEAKRVEAIKQMNRRVEARPVPPPAPKRRPAFEEAAEAFTDLPLGDVMRFVTERMEKREVEETDYDLTSQFEPVRKEEAVIAREHTTESHFHEASGIRTSVHDLSSLATAPRINAPKFAFASRRKPKALQLLAPADMRKYVIASEILGKPRALRRGR